MQQLLAAGITQTKVHLAKTDDVICAFPLTFHCLSPTFHCVSSTFRCLSPPFFDVFLCCFLGHACCCQGRAASLPRWPVLWSVLRKVKGQRSKVKGQRSKVKASRKENVSARGDWAHSDGGATRTKEMRCRQAEQAGSGHLFGMAAVAAELTATVVPLAAAAGRTDRCWCWPGPPVR